MKIISSLTFLALTFFAAFLDTAGAQPLTITTIAGQFKNAGYINNSVGTNALFEAPSGISADQAGNLYVIDLNAIRKIDPNLMVKTIEGIESYIGYQDASTNALFADPWDLAVDKNGYIYVADWGNNVVRKISPVGVVTTLAGNGTQGYIDATGTNAEFGGLYGIAVDPSGIVYVSDNSFPPPYTTSYCLIRKITPDGVVSTLAGGASGYNDGVGTGAQFFGPAGLAVDAGGTVYVADGFGIRKVAPDGTVTTWAGSQNNSGTELDGIGANAGFYGARGIALDRSGGAYVTDENGETIRYVYAAGVVTTVAGLANQAPTTNYNDGVGSDARFTSPYGIAVNSAGTVFITDEFGRTVLAGEPPSLSPINSVSESAGVTPIRSNNPWQFTAVFTNIVSDVRLRVQSTSTTNIEASWTDLPVNLDMTDVGGLWTLNTTNSSITNVPTGTQYFRVVASAPGYFDSVSAPVGPEIVLGIPQLSDIGFFLLTTGGTPVRSSNPWQFVASYTNLVPGLQLRVQSTTTTNDAGSWTDLPGIHYMTNNNAGGWTLDKTDVPTGVQYFRVVASAPGYVDGTSSTVGPQTVLQGFDLWGYFSYATTVPYSTATSWGFAIGQPSQIPGMSLRVQWSVTNNDENSWTDLPGGGQMTRQSDGVNWGIGTTNLPTGPAIYFRVVASASDYVDLVSALLGPFEIRPPLPVHATTLSTGGSYTLKSFDLGAAWNNVIHVVAGVVAHIFHNGDTTPQGATTLSADEGGSVDLTVDKGQVLNTAGVNVASKATLIVSGTVDGPVTVGVPLVGHDGASLVGHDGASVAQDGGTAALAAQIAQNGLISQDGSNLVGHDGASIVAQGAGNVIGVNGSAVAGGNTKGYSPVGGPLQPKPNDQLPTQPAFTGLMTINGNYSQFPGTALIIGIAGTNTLAEGAQQFDQLVVNGQVNFEGGTIDFVLLDPDDQTNRADVFQPPDGATFDVVIASNIVVNALHLLGPVWGDGLFFKGGVVTLTNGLQAVRLMATHIPPQLFIQNAGSELHLLYGTNYTGYTVESSPDLVNWSTFSTGTNVVPLSITNSSQFFRLSKP